MKAIHSIDHSLALTVRILRSLAIKVSRFVISRMGLASFFRVYSIVTTFKSRFEYPYVSNRSAGTLASSNRRDDMHVIKIPVPRRQLPVVDEDHVYITGHQEILHVLANVHDAGE